MHISYTIRHAHGKISYEDLLKIAELSEFTESRPVDLQSAYERSLQIYGEVFGRTGINVFRKEVLGTYNDLYSTRNTAGIVHAVQQVLVDMTFSRIPEKNRADHFREIAMRERRFDNRRQDVHMGILRAFAIAQKQSVGKYRFAQGISATALYGSWGRNTATRYSDVDFYALTLGEEIHAGKNLDFQSGLYNALLDNARTFDLYMFLQQESKRWLIEDLDFDFANLFTLYKKLAESTTKKVYEFTLITVHPNLIETLPKIFQNTDPNLQIDPIIASEELYAASVFLPSLAGERFY